MVEQVDPEKQANTMAETPEKAFEDADHIEKTASDENLVYDGEEEPELHMRTYIALASMFLLNLVQVFALQGPPAVVSPLFLLLVAMSRLTWSSFPTSAQASTTLKRRPGSQTLYPSSRQSFPL